MCKRQSGVCNRFWVESVSKNRCRVGYSRPDEYGSDDPVYVEFAVLPGYDRTRDKDNPRVIIGEALRIIGGSDDYDPIQYFEPIMDGETLWRGSSGVGDWKTAKEIEESMGVGYWHDFVERFFNVRSDLHA